MYLKWWLQKQNHSNQTVVYLIGWLSENYPESFKSNQVKKKQPKKPKERIFLNLFSSVLYKWLCSGFGQEDICRISDWTLIVDENDN